MIEAAPPALKSTQGSRVSAGGGPGLHFPRLWSQSLNWLSAPLAPALGWGGSDACGGPSAQHVAALYLRAEMEAATQVFLRKPLHREPPAATCRIPFSPWPGATPSLVALALTEMKGTRPAIPTAGPLQQLVPGAAAGRRGLPHSLMPPLPGPPLPLTPDHTCRLGPGSPGPKAPLPGRNSAPCCPCSLDPVFPPRDAGLTWQRRGPGQQGARPPYPLQAWLRVDGHAAGAPGPEKTTGLAPLTVAMGAFPFHTPGHHV